LRYSIVYLALLFAAPLLEHYLMHEFAIIVPG